MMTDLNYKKYSLENLENWLYDSMSAGEATPQEIYDVIVNVVKDNYYTYKKQASEAYELLTLLNGNAQYTEEELNAMCDKAESDEEKDKCREYNLREAEYYNKRAELDVKTDQVNRWVLPVDVDGLTGECYINLPDDLLERAGLKEGDMVNWIDRKDGSFELRKVNGTK